MIELNTTENDYLALKVSGKLETADYERFRSEVEQLIQRRSKLRILLEMEAFHGWTAGALWEDIKFDARHFSDIERLALVGERQWQKRLAVFCKPFTAAKVRYFDRRQMEDAQSWLETD